VERVFTVQHLVDVAGSRPDLLESTEPEDLQGAKLFHPRARTPVGYADARNGINFCPAFAAKIKLRSPATRHIVHMP
jgi:hypothetical protein